MTVNPDKYTVSIVPLDVGVGAVSKVLADGSLKVYLNNLWESDRRADALKAEQFSNSIICLFLALYTAFYTHFDAIMRYLWK